MSQLQGYHRRNATLGFQIHVQRKGREGSRDARLSVSLDLQGRFAAEEWSRKVKGDACCKVERMQRRRN